MFPTTNHLTHHNVKVAHGSLNSLVLHYAAQVSVGGSPRHRAVWPGAWLISNCAPARQKHIRAGGHLQEVFFNASNLCCTPGRPLNFQLQPLFPDFVHQGVAPNGRHIQLHLQQRYKNADYKSVSNSMKKSQLSESCHPKGALNQV